MTEPKQDAKTAGQALWESEGNDYSFGEWKHQDRAVQLDFERRASRQLQAEVERLRASFEEIAAEFEQRASDHKRLRPIATTEQARVVSVNLIIAWEEAAAHVRAVASRAGVAEPKPLQDVVVDGVTVRGAYERG